MAATASSFWLTNARLPLCFLPDSNPGMSAVGADFVAADIHVKDGLISAIAAPAPRDGEAIDADQGLVFPTFVDSHTHLDKGHIWPRQDNPDGRFDSAIAAVMTDRERYWSEADLRARMDFSLRCAHAHGTSAMRSHIDAMPEQMRISLPLCAEMRQAWADRIRLQAAALFAIDRALDPAYMADLAALAKECDLLLGPVAYQIPELEPALDAIFELALRHDLGLDFHADENLDPQSHCLRAIAKAAAKHGYPRRILVGHCCALSVQSDDEVKHTLDHVAAVDIAIVSLPMCNLFLQDREPVTGPRRRGATLLKALRARHIAVAVASDNVRDPFFGYGDMDGLEVLREAVRIGQLDCPVGDWPAAISRWPAAILGFGDAGLLGAGRAADFILFRARDYSELFSRPQGDRRVFRRGRLLDSKLPDYRELDAVIGAGRGA